MVLVTSTIQLEINSIRLYEYGFDRYKVSEDTGIEKTQLSTVAKVLIDYFNYRLETPQLTVRGRSGENLSRNNIGTSLMPCILIKQHCPLRERCATETEP